MATRARKTELVNTAATTSISCTQANLEPIVKRAVEAAIAVVTSDLNRLWRDKIEELENRLAEMEATNHDLESKIQSFLNESSKISAQQSLWEKAIQKAEVDANDFEQHNRRSNISAAFMGEGNTESRSAC